jgi:serine/threonine protein phosphatase PrpC
MEDGYTLVDRLGGDESAGLFAVFDGHGGTAAMTY